MKVLGRTPLVSVIMASYNHAPFVASAVETVLEQGIAGLEMIVVDDGSTDGTPEQVERIGDSRVRLVRLNDNRRSSPRNVALGLAKGRYVAFQNSDDEWCRGKLRAQLEFMEENPGFSACFTGVGIIDERGDTLAGSWAGGLFSTENRTRNRWLRQFFDHGNCLCISSVLVRRKQVEAVGRFRASLVQVADLDLWVRLAAQGEFHVDERPLTRFRVVGEKNASAPTEARMRRYVIEFADVLGRYARQPVLGLLGDVFGDVMPDNAGGGSIPLAALARYAWTLGPSHHLFADRALIDMLDDPAEREEVTGVFGAQLVHDFIRKRGGINVDIDD